MNWVFSPHLLPLPPAATEPHTPPLPPKPGLCRFLGTVVPRTLLINRQARGGCWQNYRSQDFCPGLAAAKLGTGLRSGRSPHSPWRLTPSWPAWACLPASGLLNSLESGAMVLSAFDGFRASPPPPLVLLAHLWRKRGCSSHPSRPVGQTGTNRCFRGTWGPRELRGQSTRSLEMFLCPGPSRRPTAW